MGLSEYIRRRGVEIAINTREIIKLGLPKFHKNNTIDVNTNKNFILPYDMIVNPKTHNLYLQLFCDIIQVIYYYIYQ